MKLSRLLLGFALVTTLASCSTQRAAQTPYTRPANAEMTSLGKRSARVERSEASSTAAKRTSENALVDKYAGKMKCDKSALGNAALLVFVDGWYGTPYKYGGKSKSGIDCSSFACALYNEVYKRNLTGTSAGLYQQCAKVKRDALQQGDLVFFKISRGRISHVGVYVANDFFVHASTKGGVMLSNLNEDYYRKYYAGAGRPKD